MAFELTEEAYALGGADTVALGLGLGALAYFAGNVYVCRSGGEGRMSPERPERGDEGTSRALMLGAVLDGIPESAVIGITLIGGGGVGVPILAAVFLSNLPEGLGSASGCAGRERRRPDPRLVGGGGRGLRGRLGDRLRRARRGVG